MQSAILDVAVGVTFLFATLSLVVTTLHEGIARLLELRARNLFEALHRLLQEKPQGGNPGKLVAAILDSSGLRARRRPRMAPAGCPDRIEPRQFAAALLRECTDRPRSADSMAAHPELKQTVDGLLAEVGGDLERARDRVARWFDDAMRQTSAAYARKAQILTRLLAATVVLVGKIDVLAYARALWLDPSLRAVATARAQSAIDAGERDPARLVDDLQQYAGVSFGWAAEPVAGLESSPWATALGLFLSYVALTLGAPFWFDALKRIAGLRKDADPRS